MSCPFRGPLPAPDSRAVTAAVGAGVASEDAHALVGERPLEQGRVERRYADGSRVLAFANGTEKERRPDGTLIVRFSNGDVQRTLPPPAPSGGSAGSSAGTIGGAAGSTGAGGPALSELYFFAASGTLQGTFAGSGGVTAFAFANGQVEVTHPAGTSIPGAGGLSVGSGAAGSTADAATKEILFPDGSLAVRPAHE